MYHLVSLPTVKRMVKLEHSGDLRLAIVKNGAECHGATLTLESQVGEGTTISLSFPRINTHSSDGLPQGPEQ
ncbi:MAG: hypothetical protein FWF30_03390 [Coriobacteriia bacterium]|nr:hypothetical protein [Coriobacteriia bacterium]